jgi:small subunit ribosomal protein S24e
MKIKIEEKHENPLLKRQDITFLVEHTGTATPPRVDVRDKLAAQMNCQTDQLYVIKLQGLYGQSTTRGLAHLYASKEEAMTQEQTHIIKRHSTEEAAPAPPAPKEEPEIAPEEKIKEKPPKKEKPPEEAKPPKKEKPPEEAKPPKKEKPPEEAKPPKKEKKAAKEPAKEEPKPAKKEEKKAKAAPKKKNGAKKPPKEKDAS